MVRRKRVRGASGKIIWDIRGRRESECVEVLKETIKKVKKGGSLIYISYTRGYDWLVMYRNERIDRSQAIGRGLG